MKFAVSVLAALLLPLLCRAGESALDVRGRAFASAGTSPDRISVGKTEFARGFHRIQSLAWHGRDLWVSNAPDLTIVRDVDGDDVADEYVLVGQHLGDEKQGLHGLVWGPDGKLYLCTGDLASLPANNLGQPVRFHRGEYERPDTPSVDRAPYEGAVLRCDPDGRNLEIVSRGLDNPQMVFFGSAFNGFGRETTGDQFRFFYGSGKLPSRGDRGEPAALVAEEHLKPYDQRGFDELLEDLGSSVPVLRVAAQEELLKRGESVKVGLIPWLSRPDLPPLQQTWALWTLGRAGKDDVEIESWFAVQPGIAKDLNTRVQCLRIIAYRLREFGFTTQVPASVVAALKDTEAKIRFEAVQALWQSRQAQRVPDLIELVAHEQDDDTSYSAWNALADLADKATLKRCLADKRIPLIRAAELALAKKRGR